MTRYCYYTATTLDGFLADDNDSLEWLFKQEFDSSGPGAEVVQEFGVQVMGSTTYEWIREHEPGRWPYATPTFVFTHRPLEPIAESIALLAGEPGEHRARIEAAAADKVVWIVGGGDLAAQFASAGMLDEIYVSIAPVTLGSGRPLFGAPFDLELASTDHNGDFIVARFNVLGPLGVKVKAAG